MEKQYLIVCGKFYDGIRPEFQEGIEILIEGRYIKEVGKNLSRPAEAEVIDLSHLTVTPGLIDAHIHSNLLRWQDLTKLPLQSETFQGLAHLHTAQRTLERGFTTIRCHSMGPWDYGIVDVKNLINKGVFIGSRMNVACHMLGSPASHGDMSAFYASNPRAAESLQQNYIGTGADFFRNWIRKEVKYGTDFIKFYLSGGFGSPLDGPEDIQLSDDELDAIITTARGLFKPTTAHVYAPNCMQKLIKFGITGMEHGSLMDEETAQMFEETDTYLVPTFCPYNEVINLDEENLKKKDPWFQAKLRKYAKWLQEGRKVIVKSNIRLGYGTDFVTVHHVYESWYEWQSWIRAGMDPFRILHAATMVNAGILEMADYIGSIEPGKLADISGWHRDLLTDEDCLSECDFVMKDGVVYPTSNKVYDYPQLG